MIVTLPNLLSKARFQTTRPCHILRRQVNEMIPFSMRWRERSLGQVQRPRKFGIFRDLHKFPSSASLPRKTSLLLPRLSDRCDKEPGDDLRKSELLLRATSQTHTHLGGKWGPVHAPVVHSRGAQSSIFSELVIESQDDLG